MKEFEHNFFIDTNIFLRLVSTENKAQHQECLELLTKITNPNLKNNSNFYTGNIVLAETIWTLQSYYQNTKQQSIDIISAILSIKNLTVKDDYSIKTALIIFENFNVKFADALISSIPEITQKKWIVISYDKDFDKLGVIRKEPNEVVKLLK